MKMVEVMVAMIMRITTATATKAMAGKAVESIS